MIDLMVLVFNDDGLHVSRGCTIWKTRSNAIRTTHHSLQDLSVMQCLEIKTFVVFFLALGQFSIKCRKSSEIGLGLVNFAL